LVRVNGIAIFPHSITRLIHTGGACNGDGCSAAQRHTKGRTMKLSSRLAILGAGIQAALFMLMLILMQKFGTASAETARRIMEVYGGAAGALGVAFLVWWYAQRRQEQRGSEPRL
jgi:1,6-anhydro-N-acetylmuramate kinase